MKFLFTFLTAIFLYSSSSAQPLEYSFQNTLDETNLSGPKLIPLCADTFVNIPVGYASCKSQAVYAFSDNCGISFYNDSASSYISETYSVELYLSFDVSANLGRIIDFKNRSSDYGLYCRSDRIQFYPALTITTTAFSPGRWSHLVLTRDSATHEVTIYRNGINSGSFTDSMGYALLDSSQVMHFFRDDTVFGNEANPGKISRLRVYNFILTDSAVTSLYNSLPSEYDQLQVSFVTNDTAQCMEGNLFEFVNASNDTGNFIQYTWLFADGNSVSTVSASHTYSFPGIYNVAVIAYSNACSDTSIQAIVVFPTPEFSLGSDTTVCGVSSLMLDAGSGWSSVVWNDSSTAQTLLIAQPGTYWAAVADSNSCMTNDSVSVLFAPLPSVSIGNDTAACGSFLLDAGNGFVSYLWNDSSLNQFLSAGLSGVYHVSVTDSNGCLNSDTASITVYPLPAPSVTGVFAFCSNDSSVLDAGAFNSYLWSTAGTSQTITVFNPGTYSVLVTDSNGCTGSDSVSVIVYPLPQLLLPASFQACDGDTLILDAGQGFFAYQWSNGDTLQITAVTSAGSYTVCVLDSNGCFACDTTIVNFHPLPSPPVITVSVTGDSLVSSSASGNQWYLNGNILSGATSQYLYPLVQGSMYWVMVTDSNGCPSAASNALTVGIAGLDFGATISFYPVPASLSAAYRINPFTTGSMIMLTDAAGKTVLHSSLSSPTGNLDISFLPDGVYGVLVMNEKMIFRSRLLVANR